MEKDDCVGVWGGWVYDVGLGEGHGSIWGYELEAEYWGSSRVVLKCCILGIFTSYVPFLLEGYRLIPRSRQLLIRDRARCFLQLRGGVSASLISKDLMSAVVIVFLRETVVIFSKVR